MIEISVCEEHNSKSTERKRFKGVGVRIKACRNS